MSYTYLNTGDFVEHFDSTKLNTEQIQLILDEAQTFIDNWLGYNLFVQPYEDEITSDKTGRIVLPNYPVTQVDEITILPPTTKPIAYTKDQIKIAWRSRDRRLFLPYGNYLVRINYHAGYTSIPPIFKIVFINLLKSSFKSDGFNFQKLYNPVKEVTSVSLAGLSQIFGLVILQG